MIPENELKIIPPYTPELLSEVQEEIERYLSSLRNGKDSRPVVLEFGAGYSTIWFALQGVHVKSVEHTDRWYSEIKWVLSRLRASHDYLSVDISLVEPEWVPLIAEEVQNESVNLVLIDCIDDQRIPAVKASIPKLKKGGILVLDDSHWDLLRPVADLLPGWKPDTISGKHVRKTGEEKYHQTTLYTKPG